MKEVSVDIRDRVTPYHHLPYEEQIAKKAEWLTGPEVLRDFSKQLEQAMAAHREYCPPWFRDVHEAIADHQKTADEYLPCCPLEKIIECDESYRDGYRNKVEFTIGRRFTAIGEQGPICVGFNLGHMAKGILYVEKPDSIKVISRESVQAAKRLEQIVEASGLEPYDRTVNKGFWRILLYRESKNTKQCMVSVVVTDPQSLPEDERPATDDQIASVQAQIASAFPFQSKFGDFTVTSVSMIFSGEISGGYKEGDRCQVLQGDGLTYTEELLGFKFTVSPFSFFQVNINVFEKMLQEIGAFLNITSDTVVFDICCGTGAIGICLSKFAKKVIGVELVEAAVENAKENVKLNADQVPEGKCEFYAGRAEMLLPDIAKQYSDQHSTIVGIVDPPRAGLHRDVLRALRTCKGLNKLVYVSCNAVSQMRDM